MRRPRPSAESGQALPLLLGVAAALLVGALALGALGQAFGAKGRSQRAADLAAISAARTMRALYPRVFEPPVLEGGVPNPHYVSPVQYRLRARATAIRAALRNGVRLAPWDVTFPAISRGDSAVGRLASLASAAYAPTRVRVTVRGGARVRVAPGRPRGQIRVRSRATAEITPSLGASLDQPAVAHGGGYEGPLAYRMGKPTPYLFQLRRRFWRRGSGKRRRLPLLRSCATRAHNPKVAGSNPALRYV
jgi:hypothetical protein